MKFLGSTLLAGAIAAGIALSSPSFAAPRQANERMQQTCEPGHPPGPRFGGGPFEHGMGHRLLRDPTLSDEQRDAIFRIHHAHAPAQWTAGRNLAKLRKEREALLGSDNYDAARADELVNREAEAYAALLRERSATEREIAAVLTPEQRARIRSREERGPQDGAGPGRHPRQ